MNFRNDKEIQEGAAYMTYLKRKEKIFQAALSLISKTTEHKEAMHIRVFSSSKYAPYMEKLRNKLCELTNLDLSFAKVDMIFSVLIEGSKVNNKIDLRKLEILKHRRELEGVNELLGLENDVAHMDTITKLMLGINPLKKEEVERAKETGVISDDDEEFFRALSE